MNDIAIFYGTTTGTTETIATKIASKLNADVFEIADVSSSQMNKYKYLIFGTSTWGDGDMQDDWDDFLNQFSDIDWSNKLVALFGVGDSYSYPDTFAGGMGLLHQALLKHNCSIVGQTDTSGYQIDGSTTAIVDGRFVGLAIDEDNESEHTDERIDSWIKRIKPLFGL